MRRSCTCSSGRTPWWRSFLIPFLRLTLLRWPVLLELVHQAGQVEAVHRDLAGVAGDRPGRHDREVPAPAAREVPAPAAHVRCGELHLGVLTLESVKPRHRVIPRRQAADDRRALTVHDRPRGGRGGHSRPPRPPPRFGGSVAYTEKPQRLISSTQPAASRPLTGQPRQSRLRWSSWPRASPPRTARRGALQRSPGGTGCPGPRRAARPFPADAAHARPPRQRVPYPGHRACPRGTSSHSLPRPVRPDRPHPATPGTAPRRARAPGARGHQPPAARAPSRGADPVVPWLLLANPVQGRG